MKFVGWKHVHPCQSTGKISVLPAIISGNKHKIRMFKITESQRHGFCFDYLNFGCLISFRVSLLGLSFNVKHIEGLHVFWVDSVSTITYNPHSSNYLLADKDKPQWCSRIYVRCLFRIWNIESYFHTSVPFYFHHSFYPSQLTIQWVAIHSCI